MPGGPLQEERRWGFALFAIVSIAFVIRLWNLGTFSLWLDEVVTLRFAGLPFDRLLAACAGDAENVPLYAVVAFLGTRAGLTEPWIPTPAFWHARLLTLLGARPTIGTMERIVHKSRSFEEAAKWDVEQQVSMTPKERMRAARELKRRAFPRGWKGVREWARMK